MALIGLFFFLLRCARYSEERINDILFLAVVRARARGQPGDDDSVKSSEICEM